jgi:hypothetical protein
MTYYGVFDQKPIFEKSKEVEQSYLTRVDLLYFPSEFYYNRIVDMSNSLFCYI